ncbi:MAG: hypothetical protein EPO39_01145 [Candidatus Manganitrophaceae bacterium]|nr:MAG: hypothetical protein EPO39_01145 [Candidatus Manganitrophaceae bacterium]
MALPKQLEAAAARLEEATWRIDQARNKPLSLESLHEWLNALTDFSLAQSEIHQLNNESIHEKLHELAGQVHLKFRSTGT